ncbi:aminoglycoside phosphotransferase family protein [Lentzea sp. PSKA42]|uniref:Aminoglycoside phosphotransferase family protein n=1 Tax=Lentzea indica TaxID=2604800 RepID=A0ABX1FC24_9PSEU|nr:aminoglycoside phosphotransferase family protein [Lentzea indica]NKE56344.1 aminoglycoside phosphotransferase family protein [Lentzea indica]
MSTSAVQTAVSLAAAHGVVSTDPVVLKDGSNVIVHLRPAPVVARIASRTALVRPSVAVHLARDLSVSAFLASRGVPVVTPSAELPAGPHTADGFVLTFSTYVPHDPSVELTRPDVLKMLPALHAELRLYEGELPVRGPMDDVENTLEYLEGLGVPDLEPFRERHAELLAEWDVHYNDVQPLHGDSHYGNLLMTPSGPVWNDFEDTWRGPVAWDLACLAGARGEEAAQRAVEIYGGGAASEDVEFHVETRINFGTLWGVLMERS